MVSQLWGLPSIIFIFLSCLAGPASPAAAEGAWALWARTTMTNENDGRFAAKWMLMNAHATRAMCEAGLATGLPLEADRIRKARVGADVRVESDVLTARYTAQGWRFKYIIEGVCLPDTINPRGPRGR